MRVLKKNNFKSGLAYDFGGGEQGLNESERKSECFIKTMFMKLLFSIKTALSGSNTKMPQQEQLHKSEQECEISSVWVNVICSISFFSQRLPVQSLTHGLYTKKRK